MLSIIVPARNDPTMTSHCLNAALYSVTRLKLSCEFVLVDDASEPDENILPLFQGFRRQATGHQVKIARWRTHRHYTGAFSLGLHLSTRDRIFFLSNDMYVTPSFISTLLAVAALSETFGIMRGTPNHTDSHPEYQLVPEQMPRSYKELDASSRSIAFEHGCAVREDKHLSGDAILISRALVNPIGVLDLRFFGYFGDVDYGMRAHLAGFKLVCAGGAWLYHTGGGHLTREAMQKGEPDSGAAFQRRMALVAAAWQQFRERWDSDLPAQFAGFTNTPFFSLAEAAADRVPRKVDFPEALLDDVELH